MILDFYVNISTQAGDISLIYVKRVDLQKMMGVCEESSRK